MWLFLAVAVLVTVLRSHERVGGAVPAALGVLNLLDLSWSAGRFGHLWSVCLELQGYVVLGPVAFMVRDRDWPAVPTILAGIVLQGPVQLVHPFRCLGPARTLASRRQGRQQQADEHHDDHQDHQQLDQGDGLAARAGGHGCQGLRRGGHGRYRSFIPRPASGVTHAHRASLTRRRRSGNRCSP